MYFLTLGAEPALCAWDAEPRVDTSLLREVPEERRQENYRLQASHCKGRRFLGTRRAWAEDWERGEGSPGLEATGRQPVRIRAEQQEAVAGLGSGLLRNHQAKP